jgi:hypothetical protein
MVYKTAHRRRRVRSSKRRNAKSRKVMRGGWNNIYNCNAEWNAVKSDTIKSAEWLKRNNITWSHNVCQQLVDRKKY